MAEIRFKDKQIATLVADAIGGNVEAREIVYYEGNRACNGTRYYVVGGTLPMPDVETREVFKPGDSRWTTYRLASGVLTHWRVGVESGWKYTPNE